MKKKMTHIAKFHGADNRTPPGYSIDVKLRETAKFWVDSHGQKYRKDTGTAVGNDAWPMYRMDVDTIKLIDIQA